MMSKSLALTLIVSFLVLLGVHKLSFGAGKHFELLCPDAEDISHAQLFTMVNEENGKKVISNQYYSIAYRGKNVPSGAAWSISTSDFNKLKTKDDSYFSSVSLSPGRMLTCTYPDGEKTTMLQEEFACTVEEKSFKCTNQFEGVRV